jgi:hypothetical protein
MPGRRRAPVKRPCAQKTARRAESFPLILRIEEPLTDAINYVQAMYLMGYGLASRSGRRCDRGARGRNQAASRSREKDLERGAEGETRSKAHPAAKKELRVTKTKRKRNRRVGWPN